ncbi:MAG: hypothetical protein SVU32_01025 [Candidatus Nanohaloarchaea archaeon]|nr:hypothetical protein [Candidatus Nanohaloarchaea archaeon]
MLQRRRGTLTPTQMLGILSLFILIALIIIPTLVEVSTPDRLDHYDSGLELMKDVVEEGFEDEETYYFFIQFFVIPLVVIWALIYSVLTSGVGRHFPPNVIPPLSIVMTVSSVFSKWFIAIAGVINVLGWTGLVSIAVLGLVLGAVQTVMNWL